MRRPGEPHQHPTFTPPKNIPINYHEQSVNLLADSLELSLPEAEPLIDEETTVRWLADVVDYWMQHRMEQLMSLCYTLDVDEAFVAAA
ncbi:MAG: hypothetical protein AAF597_14855, partial [Bacteroidota bacterium]